MSNQELFRADTEVLGVAGQQEIRRSTSNGRANSLSGLRHAVSLSMHRPVVKIFIVYENDLNLFRVECMREELFQRLGQTFAFSVSWRSAESLKDREIREAATHSVEEADIICFALPSGGEIPRHITTWLKNELLGRKTRKLCLLSLVETGQATEPRLSRAEIYLSELSVAAGVDCLCYSDSIPIVRRISSERGEKRPQKCKRGACGSARGKELVDSRILFTCWRRLAETVGVEKLRQ